MEYNGKKVFTSDEFEYSKAKVGDYVEQQIVDDAMNILPPAYMSAECSQIGEPYGHREDPTTGKWRATFTTFKKVGDEYPNGIWQYCGHCFYRETTERWNDHE